MIKKVQVLPILNAPATGTGWIKIRPSANVRYSLRISVANVNTSVNIRLQYSSDGTTLQRRGIGFDLTTNETFIFDVPTSENFFRLWFNAEAGGTDAVISSSLITQY